MPAFAGMTLAHWTPIYAVLYLVFWLGISYNDLSKSFDVRVIKRSDMNRID